MDVEAERLMDEFKASPEIPVIPHQSRLSTHKPFIE